MNLSSNTIILLSAGASVFSCLFQYFLRRKSNSLINAGENHFLLTKEEAFYRSNNVKVNNYTLFLFLPHSSSRIYAQHYFGSVKINFELNKHSDHFFIDFGGKVEKVIVNGIETKNYWVKENRIFFKEEEILIGNNNLTICFSNSYSSSSFIFDNNNEYFYMKKEPFYTHLTFPCFDQPDFLSTFKLYVVTTNYLQVNSLESEECTISEPNLIQAKLSEFNLDMKPYSDEYILKEFSLSVPITTYNFPLILGKFITVEDILNSVENIQHKIRLFFRKSNFSINKQVIDSTMNLILQIIVYYNKFFQSEKKLFNEINIHFLPEKKCIDFTSNIIISESFISGHMNPVDSNYFNTLLSYHISNMWIINSTSMPWWEDRYLLDAISVYLAHICISHLYKEETPLILFSFYKLKSFRADCLQTTHKVRYEVLDSECARIRYDEIYGYKFTCLVQNLHNMIGEKEFLLALSSYVTNNLLNTLSINSFIDHLKSGNFHDQSKWFEYCIDREGFSKLQIHITEKSQKISNAFVLQKSTSSHLYNHKVLLIYNNRKESITIEVSQLEKTEIASLLDKEVPRAFILNYNDKGYFRQIFSGSSLEFVIQYIEVFMFINEAIKDNITKTVISRDLAEMTQDGLLDPLYYLEFTQNILHNSINDNPGFVVQQIALAKFLILNYIPFDRQSNPKNILLKIIIKLVFNYPLLKDVLLNHLLDVLNPSYIQHFQLLERSMLNVNHSENSNDISNIILNLENINNNTKLRLLEAIFESEYNVYEQKISLKRSFLENYPDNDFPKYYETILDACLPNEEMKKGYYLTLVYKDLNLPLRKYEAIMRGFARKSQLDILKVYFKTSFFEDFCYVLNNHGKEYAISYFNWMNPCFLVNENMIKKFQRLLTSIPNEENDIKVLITSRLSQMKGYFEVIKKR